MKPNKLTNKNGVPDRWRDYKAIGKVIPDTKFIAFKVPLHKHICERLPSPERHTTSDVVNSIPQLGIVISLTNTQNDSKYYQPHDWKRYGVEYKWIRTEGHVVPPRRLLIEFCRIVKKYMEENPEKLVGVHCTHGLNRTGYFVCSYMVLCNNLSPNVVLKNFADARGHEIERPNYINAIIHHCSNAELQQAIEKSMESGCEDEQANSSLDLNASKQWKRASTSRVEHKTEPKRKPRENWRFQNDDRNHDRNMQSWRPRDSHRPHEVPHRHQWVGRNYGPRSENHNRLNRESRQENFYHRDVGWSQNPGFQNLSRNHVSQFNDWDDWLERRMAQ